MPLTVFSLVWGEWVYSVYWRTASFQRKKSNQWKNITEGYSDAAGPIIPAPPYQIGKMVGYKDMSESAGWIKSRHRCFMSVGLWCGSSSLVLGQRQHRTIWVTSTAPGLKFIWAGKPAHRKPSKTPSLTENIRFPWHISSFKWKLDNPHSHAFTLTLSSKLPWCQELLLDLTYLRIKLFPFSWSRSCYLRRLKSAW